MAENPCISIPFNISNALLVNREAHQSRRLLHRRSSDEDNGDDDEDVDEETEIIEEEQKNDEVEVIEEDNSDDTPIIEPNDDHFNHSISAPVFPSTPISPFPTTWGRGSSSKSTVLQFNFVYLFFLVKSIKF
jgi:hypothetical protein